LPRASIDIGSNSILLLVLDDKGQRLHDEARVVGLGRGLAARGMFQPDRMDAAAEILRDYARTASSLGVPPYEVRAVATSASRRALNARSFYERVRAESGLQVEIISGVQEALYTWLGARHELRLPDGPIAVVDLGGGSTEVVLGEGPEPGPRCSLEIGTVRLTEEHLGLEADRYRPADLARLRAAVQEALQAGLSWPALPRALVAVAGTATTLAAMDAGLVSWDRSRVHGRRLTRNALLGQIDLLLHADRAERRRLAAVSPERADTLLAGAVVLEAVLGHARRDSLIASDGGVRRGVLAG